MIRTKSFQEILQEMLGSFPGHGPHHVGLFKVLQKLGIKNARFIQFGIYDIEAGSVLNTLLEASKKLDDK